MSNTTPKKKAVTVGIRPDLYQEIAKIAGKKYITTSGLVSMVLAEYVAANKNEN